MDLIEGLQATGLNPLVIDENTDFSKLLPLKGSEAPSPFLEGTNIQFAWDSTSIGYLKQCPRLYQYVMIDGWTPKGENIHLRFGQEYHKALEEYDISRADGMEHDDALRYCVRRLLGRTFTWQSVEPRNRNQALKTRRNLVRAVIWYLLHFEDDSAKTYIRSDGSAAVELSFRFELDWGPKPEDCAKDGMLKQPYLLCGHLDRLVEYNETLMGMDRKTSTTTLSSYYFDSFEPNNQMTLYTLALATIFDAPIKGMIIDACQILTDTARFVRGTTYRTPAQLDEWIKDLEYWFNQAESYAEANYWPQNDTACGMYGGCRFREVCSKSPQVREAFLKSKFEKGEKWNPLKPR